jgi:hypothetical protein
MRSMRRILETVVVPRYQYFISREESESLLSTDRRLNRVDRTNAQDEVSSGFWEVSRRRSSSLSSMQVLRMAESESLLSIV